MQHITNPVLTDPSEKTVRRPPSLIRGFARSRCIERFKSLRHGALVLQEPDGMAQRFGQADGSEVPTVIVNDDAFYTRALFRGELGLGESYVDGTWDARDDGVSEILQVFLRNATRPSTAATVGLRFAATLHDWNHMAARQTAAPDLSFHHDLPASFFRTFLDSRMVYSCGYRASPLEGLDEMQWNKLEITARELDLREGDNFLDLGCGWGSMLVHAAERYGARAVGVTLSRPQVDWIRERVGEKGLGDRVKAKLMDYRDVGGRFDKIASIGMLEHVGRAQWSEFFAKLAALLRPGGRALVQTIGTTAERRPGPWLRRYIFPGTWLPRAEDLVRHVEKSGLALVRLENWKPHYAETARQWIGNFRAHASRFEALGPAFGREFRRAWHYYLSLLEASFRHGPLQLYRCTIRKPPFELGGRSRRGGG